MSRRAAMLGRASRRSGLERMKSAVARLQAIGAVVDHGDAQQRLHVARRAAGARAGPRRRCTMSSRPSARPAPTCWSPPSGPLRKRWTGRPSSASTRPPVVPVPKSSCSASVPRLKPGPVEQVELAVVVRDERDALAVVHRCLRAVGEGHRHGSAPRAAPRAGSQAARPRAGGPRRGRGRRPGRCGGPPGGRTRGTRPRRPRCRGPGPAGASASASAARATSSAARRSPRPGRPCRAPRRCAAPGPPRVVEQLDLDARAAPGPSQGTTAQRPRHARGRSSGTRSPGSGLVAGGDDARVASPRERVAVGEPARRRWRCGRRARPSRRPARGGRRPRARASGPRAGCSIAAARRGP